MWECAQIFSSCYFNWMQKSLNLRASLKVRVLRAILVQWKNIKMKNELWGLKTPNLDAGCRSKA